MDTCKNCDIWDKKCEEFDLEEDEGFCVLHKIITNKDDKCVTKNHQEEFSLSITSLIKTNDNYIIEFYIDDVVQKMEVSHNVLENLFEIMKEEFDGN